jgi:hypothetical protein
MTLIFARERETKNTVRFQEVVPADGTAVIGTLYVQKAVAQDAGAVTMDLEFYADVATADA